MTTVAQRAVDAAMEVECKKDSLKQNQDGTWKFTLTIAPGGLPDAMMKAAPGTRYTAVFVEVDDVEEPVKHAPAASEKAKKPFKDYTLSQQAGMRCENKEFWMFADQQDAQSTTLWLYKKLGILSRRELDKDKFFGERWIKLNAEYEIWAGLSAEAR